MSEVRIGDAERELAQTTLNDHYAAGRLDHDEYTERLDRIWAARTRAELDPVFTDLPGPAPQRSGRSSYPYSTAATRRPSSAPRPRGSRLPLPLLVLLIVVGTIAVATNLPLILVGLGVWFFFLRGGGCRSQSRRVMRG
ncbi:MAG TPA: DUF1707 domain-containing protein [Nocardioidaceae bacterium]|nr:DUF1707 domain-containing protein [Nocardioidaceae bacterium]